MGQWGGASQTLRRRVTAPHLLRRLCLNPDKTRSRGRNQNVRRRRTSGIGRGHPSLGAIGRRRRVGRGLSEGAFLCPAHRRSRPQRQALRSPRFAAPARLARLSRAKRAVKRRRCGGVVL
jgi:hypothetical protein